MTMLELANRDFRKAHNSLVAAKKRPNVPMKELAHLEELLELRRAILDLVRDNAFQCPDGGDETSCEDCIYGVDYEFVDGRCVRRTCDE